jgi:phosphoribosylanthranilate isomerase
VRRTRVKICGLTRRRDAARAAVLGADAIGVVFAASPRRITPEQARQVLDAADGLVNRVGVFADQELSYIREVVDHCRLDLVQLCGSESPELARGVRVRVLRTVHVRRDTDISAAEHYPADVFLLDAPAHGNRLGGTGRTFDWSTAAVLPWPRDRVIVAGGLDAGNVGDVIERLRPGGVDVSSGVESAPGIKDAARLEAFIAAVHRADTRAHEYAAAQLEQDTRRVD